jgi:hypothetical protein
MNIDSPGVEALEPGFDREVFGAAGFETDRGARAAFGVDFTGGAGLSANGSGLRSDLVSDGDFGSVLARGRFFFSGMPVEIIPSVGGCDQLASFIALHVELHEPTANAKIPRSEDPKASLASAATRFAGQGVKETQIQAPLDHELLASVFLWLPVRRPLAGGDGRTCHVSGWRWRHPGVCSGSRRTFFSARRGTQAGRSSTSRALPEYCSGENASRFLPLRPFDSAILCAFDEDVVLQDEDHPARLAPARQPGT